MKLIRSRAPLWLGVAVGGSAAYSQHLAVEFVSRFYFDRPGLTSSSLTIDIIAGKKAGIGDLIEQKSIVQ